MFCKYINIIVYAVQNDRVRWYGFYNEREHECVGKVQLFLNYTTTSGEIGSAKVCAILVGVETTCMLKSMLITVRAVHLFWGELVHCSFITLNFDLSF
jgi:hypothetical protein